MENTKNSLEVPGATLYYEVVGNGPLLLCISGGSGSADYWRPLVNQLKDNFTVAIYDRRGFSRSYLSATVDQDYEHRIETDADDASALIKYLSPAEQPVKILANSSGAVVSLVLLLRHPDLVDTLVCHEPPALKVLPDREDLTAKQLDIYQTYRRSGIPAALKKFAALYKVKDAEFPIFQASMDARRGPFVGQNSIYWFEREIPVYPLQDFDLQALAKYKKKLILAAGEDTDPSAPHYRANESLAKICAKELTIVPGGHTGFATHPVEWAEALIKIAPP
ncbi:hypothetical protein PV08_01059 [Exophiala spinifera]|uniref:AB hydrolase-1 domain-containing protein n=1 Tax=Exophiala spinifera TaxID=91928 RepID=A0A0D2CAA2_9EURO|nr:uncharacterized protein PV08_01059 [Exophiala spinifera]KIW20484.1 hypothetical protein PV08_01059 [Exophiala spinifera]